MDMIARICWNSNGWTQPSGSNGKSSAKDTFEGKYHFGYEEWLFNKAYNINGYNYGFLQQFNQDWNLHVNKTYNIHLLTFQSKVGLSYIAYLPKVKVIDDSEQLLVFDYFNKHGLIQNMRIDLQKVNCKPVGFNKSMFNVRFKLEEAKIIYPNTPTFNPNLLKNLRYKLFDLSKILQF